MEMKKKKGYQFFWKHTKSMYESVCAIKCGPFFFLRYDQNTGSAFCAFNSSICLCTIILYIMDIVVVAAQIASR